MGFDLVIKYFDKNGKKIFHFVELKASEDKPIQSASHRKNEIDEKFSNFTSIKDTLNIHFDFDLKVDGNCFYFFMSDKTFNFSIDTSNSNLEKNAKIEKLIEMIKKFGMTI